MPAPPVISSYRSIHPSLFSFIHSVIFFLSRLAGRVDYTKLMSVDNLGVAIKSCVGFSCLNCLQTVRLYESAVCTLVQSGCTDLHFTPLNYWDACCCKNWHLPIYNTVLLMWFIAHQPVFFMSCVEIVVKIVQI